MAQTKCSKYSLFYSKRYQLKDDTSTPFIRLRNDIFTTNYTNPIVYVALLVCCMEGE